MLQDAMAGGRAPRRGGGSSKAAYQSMGNLSPVSRYSTDGPREGVGNVFKDIRENITRQSFLLSIYREGDESTAMEAALRKYC